MFRPCESCRVDNNSSPKWSLLNAVNTLREDSTAQAQVWQLYSIFGLSGFQPLNTRIINVAFARLTQTYCDGQLAIS